MSAGGVFNLSAVDLDNNGFVVNAEDGAVGRDVTMQKTGPGKKNALSSAVSGKGEDAGIHNSRGRRAVCGVEVWEDGVTVCLLHDGCRQWAVCVFVCGICEVGAVCRFYVYCRCGEVNTRPPRAKTSVYIRAPEHVKQYISRGEFKRAIGAGT